MTIDGIPIRDHASLAQTCGDAVVRLGYSEDGKQARLKRYRLRSSESPTLKDLDGYLSTSATFFETFAPFMLPFTRLAAISDGLAIARETYVLQMAEDRWMSRLEELGAKRLDDEVVFIGPGEAPSVIDSINERKAERHS